MLRHLIDICILNDCIFSHNIRMIDRLSNLFSFHQIDCNTHLLPSISLLLLVSFFFSLTFTFVCYKSKFKISVMIFCSISSFIITRQTLNRFRQSNLIVNSLNKSIVVWINFIKNVTHCQKNESHLHNLYDKYGWIVYITFAEIIAVLCTKMFVWTWFLFGH